MAGHKQYPKWYAYGRSQALYLEGKRLLFPHICDFPCFIYCENEALLFYDGYSIFAESSRKLEIVRRVLTSSLFFGITSPKPVNHIVEGSFH